MTTSKTLHHHLVALSQQGRRRRKYQERKHGVNVNVNNKAKSARRVVELAKVVLHSASGMGHHVTKRTAVVAASESATPTASTFAKEGTSDTTTVDDHNNNSSRSTGNTDTYYAQLRVQLAREIQGLEDQRIQARQKQVEVWGIYKYALEKVSNLNDLRDAPDAILPGNFVERPPVAATAAAPESTQPATNNEVWTRI